MQYDHENDSDALMKTQKNPTLNNSKQNLFTLAQEVDLNDNFDESEKKMENP